MADTERSDSTAGEAAAQESGPRIRIKVKAYDYKIVDQSTKQICEAVERTGARVYGPVPLPTERKLYTVNRSTFVNKDARDQYEIRVHKRLIDIQIPSPSLISKATDALQSLQLPAGVDVSMK